MRLLTAVDIKAWDQYTIENEPIASIDLMERASLSFVRWFVNMFQDTNIPVNIFCGNGNNGGDGLAIARLLRDRFYNVSVHIVHFANQDSLDFSINLQRVQSTDEIALNIIYDELPLVSAESIVIDALTGTGLNRSLTASLQKVVEYLNQLSNTIVAVDIPSGMLSEGITLGPAVKAAHIYTFGLPKLSFFLQENYVYCPKWTVGDIGLLEGFVPSNDTKISTIDLPLVKNIYKPRQKHQHKGNFGHALMIAGSDGKIGAAILATKACLKSGVGLVTSVVPKDAKMALHGAVPEAMVENFDFSILVKTFDGSHKYTVGIGPGLGTDVEKAKYLSMLLELVHTPMVVDADALNIISANPMMLYSLPPKSILTPHPKEFERLFGKTTNEVERIQLAKVNSTKFNIILVLKGAFTRVLTPDGREFINTTGNPGMATAGSGDVLTGIITSLLAQSYTPENAAILGVFAHGLAADISLSRESKESLMASDIIEYLGKAFGTVEGD